MTAPALVALLRAYMDMARDEPEDSKRYQLRMLATRVLSGAATKRELREVPRQVRAILSGGRAAA